MNQMKLTSEGRHFKAVALLAVLFVPLLGAD
jgi:hypothetical protein